MKNAILFTLITILTACGTTKTKTKDPVASIEFKTGVSLDRQERLMIWKKSPKTLAKLENAAPLEVEDIIALSDIGISDFFLKNYFIETNAKYDLRHADIVKLQQAGVAQQIIHLMINTSR